MERLTNPLIVPKTGEVLAYKLNPGVTDTRAKTKLGKYEDLEEQGLLFRLPCKVGDKVYRPVPKLYRRISVMTVVKIVIHEDGVYFKTDKDGGLFKTSAIGKTFFITKEKAEAALEKMKGEEYDKS